MTGSGLPPASETRDNPAPVVPANTIIPLAPQLAPAPTGAAHNVIGKPPDVEIFLSCPSAKNPIQRLSGEKKGVVAFAVPPSGLASTLFIGRTNNSG